jgi:hypothetical protein
MVHPVGRQPAANVVQGLVVRPSGDNVMRSSIDGDATNGMPAATRGNGAHPRLTTDVDRSRSADETDHWRS